MAYTALAVANAFIRVGEKHQCDPITPMKLQKLIYYAHAWHLHFTNKPLINEPFEKWKHGPVIPSIYHEFKDFGGAEITTFGTRPSAEDPESLIFPIVRKDDANVWKLIEMVCRRYGKLDGVDLSIMTHRTGSAWSRTPHFNQPIPDELIREDVEGEPQHAAN